MCGCYRNPDTGDIRKYSDQDYQSPRHNNKVSPQSPIHAEFDIKDRPKPTHTRGHSLR